MEFNPKWNNQPNSIGARQQSKIDLWKHFELNFNCKYVFVSLFVPLLQMYSLDVFIYYSCSLIGSVYQLPS